MRVFLIICVAVLVPDFAYCQYAGSREVYRSMVDAANQEALARIEYEGSKKISTNTSPGLTFEQAGKESKSPMNFAADEIGIIASLRFKVLQVVDKNNCILKADQSVVWLSGYDTANLLDDMPVRIVEPVKCLGQKQYAALSGASKTIPHFTLASVDYIEKWHKERVDREYPEFKLKNGTNYRAKVVGYTEKTKVFEVQEPNGETRKVRLIDLVDGPTKDDLRKRMQDADKGKK